MVTVVSAFQALVGSEPLLTWYDDATGERTELSGVSLDNWVAKTANLLRDAHGLGPGDTAVVLLPPHWMTAGVLLGCWSAGLAVVTTDQAADVAFVGPDGSSQADEVYALSLSPFGLPFRPAPPAGTIDYSVDVRAHGDHFHPARVAPDDLALDGRTHGELVAAAPPVPARRVMIDVDAHPTPLEWLVAPLVAGASIVAARNIDPDRISGRVAQERATIFAPGQYPQTP